jgi:hypothetical protein
VNDAPTASHGTITTNEDTARALAVADFGFADVEAGNTLQSVTLTSLPTAGSLKLNGVAVTANQVIIRRRHRRRQLVFTPAANANGLPATRASASRSVTAPRCPPRLTP